MNPQNHNTDKFIEDRFIETAIFNDGDIALFKDMKGLSGEKQRNPIDAYIFILCTQGKSSFFTGGIHYELTANGLFIAQPNIFFNDLMFSHDFECCCIAISNQAVQKAVPISVKSWEIKQMFNSHPHLQLNERDVKIFHQYFDLIETKLTGTPIKHINSIVKALTAAFLLELHDTLDRFITFTPKPFNAAERVFRQFINLLASTHPKQRSVTYYATELHITPKYLSTICRKNCGESATTIINNAVMKDIQQLMRFSSKTIKEIAFELDFPSISFFGKFVKRHVGMSPSTLRKSYITTVQDEASDANSDK